MERIGLVDAIASLRAELLLAHERANSDGLTFPIESVQLEFQVGVTRDAGARSGLRFWIAELGADARIGREQVQTITVTLGPPLLDGETVAVRRGLDVRP
jgi:hypothetical protein